MNAVAWLEMTNWGQRTEQYPETQATLAHSEFSVDNSACLKTNCVASSARSGG